MSNIEPGRVLLLQKELNKRGHKLKEDDDFGPLTCTAALSELGVKIEVPKLPHIPISSDSFKRSELAVLAEFFCAKNLARHSPEIVEVKKDFFGPPAKFGSGDWPHCAATVRWLCNQAGCNVPVLCPTGYTFAYVPAWHKWAVNQGFFIKNDGKVIPEAGDIVLYDWDADKSDDHIGVHLRMNGKYYVAAEGNTDGGQTKIKNRVSANILGWVRIPDGYRF